MPDQNDRLRADIPELEPDAAFMDRLASIAVLSAQVAPSPIRRTVRVAVAALAALVLLSGAAYAAAKVVDDHSEPRNPAPTHQVPIHPATPGPTGTPTPTDSATSSGTDAPDKGPGRHPGEDESDEPGEDHHGGQHSGESDEPEDRGHNGGTDEPDEPDSPSTTSGGHSGDSGKNASGPDDSGSSPNVGVPSD